MLEIHMWEPERERFLKRHDFFIEQAKSRILDNFKDEDIESEAEQKKEEFFEKKGSMPYSEDVDMGDIAEEAEEHGADFGIMLYEMKVQIILATLASLYHQWEKDFRDYMARESRHAYSPASLEKKFWKSNIDDLFDGYELFGWDIREKSWFPKIDACRLIVNVYKHGKGPALDKLRKKYPQYLKGAFDVGELDAMFYSYEDLAIKPEDFDEIAAAFRLFWVEFPSRQDLIDRKNDIPF